MQKDIVIKAIVGFPDNERLFSLISKIPLKYAYKPSRYHVTIAYLKNVELNDAEKIVDYFEHNFHEIWSHYSMINFNTSDACSFHNKIALTPSNPKVFKELNLKTRELLSEFNQRNEKNYIFELRSYNENYTPHITIGEGTHITLGIIKSLINENIQKDILTIRFSKIVAKIMP
jgi:2'-5' RNA ligase